MKKAVNVSGGKKKRRTMVYGACEGALQDGVVQVVGPCRRSPKCVFVRALSKQSLRSVSTSLWSVLQCPATFSVQKLFRRGSVSLPCGSSVPFAGVLWLSPESRAQGLPLHCLRRR